MMTALNHRDVSELRLEMIGSASMTKTDVEEFQWDATRAHDRAVEVRRTPFYGDIDVCSAARSYVVGGAHDLIDRGYHREAAWFIWVGHFFAHTAIRNDAPEEYERTFRYPYERLLKALGIDSCAALERKAAIARDLVPRVTSVAEEIMAGTRFTG